MISDDEYTLLKRIVIDGISYVEAAKELDISMWACRKRVQRIIDKIHKKWHTNSIKERLRGREEGDLGGKIQKSA